MTELGNILLKAVIQMIGNFSDEAKRKLTIRNNYITRLHSVLEFTNFRVSVLVEGHYLFGVSFNSRSSTVN